MCTFDIVFYLVQQVCSTLSPNPWTRWPLVGLPHSLSFVQMTNHKLPSQKTLWGSLSVVGQDEHMLSANCWMMIIKEMLLRIFYIQTMHFQHKYWGSHLHAWLYGLVHNSSMNRSQMLIQGLWVWPQPGCITCVVILYWKDLLHHSPLYLTQGQL